MGFLVGFRGFEAFGFGVSGVLGGLGVSGLGFRA